MAEKTNTTCAICGKGYYLCLACKSHNLTPWKLHTDTAEHYKIFQILRGVTLNVYTISEAKEKLKTVDLSDLESFKDGIKKRIKEIMAYQEPVKPVPAVQKQAAYIKTGNETAATKPVVNRRKHNVKKAVETDVK